MFTTQHRATAHHNRTVAQANQLLQLETAEHERMSTCEVPTSLALPILRTDAFSIVMKAEGKQHTEANLMTMAVGA